MGKKAYTQKEAEAFAKSYQYTLLDAYQGYHKSHLFLCPEGHEEEIIFHKIKKGTCRSCADARMREQNRLHFKIIVDFF